MLRLVRGLCDDPTEADDVLQETFLAAARHATSCRERDARAWLIAIAANRARDARRGAARRRRRERAASRPEAPAPVPRAEADVEAALARLSERDRTVLELRHVQGLSHARTAEVLGVSLRTAKSWAARALDALRAALEEDA